MVQNTATKPGTTPKPPAEPKPVPTDAEKRKAFKAIAQARVNLALAALARIGSLAQPSKHLWTSADITKIRSVLTAEVDRAIARLENPAAPRKGSFELDD